ncbi:MAG: hypothetical protein RLZZ214_304 [Verrucomicrobiota bacterium]|jgi:hypothetical protein
MRALFLFLVLLLPASVSGQEARPVNCRFLRFGGSDDSASVLALSSKGAEATCPLSTSSLSAPIVCFAAENKIAFLSAGDRKPAATATIPGHVKSAILVFVQAPRAAESASSTPLPWRILVIEDSPKNFPDGGAFVANFHDTDIRFIVGEHKGMLHPAGNHGYAMPAERDAFNMAPVMFEFQQGEKWRTANESTLRFLPGMRYLIIAYTDPASGRPRISTCQDFTAPAPLVP